MEETDLIDPTATVNDEVTETAHTEADTTGNQDIWSEDFDPNAPDTPDEPQEQEQDEESAEKPEYKTKGLGKLDKPLVVKRKGKLYDLTDLDQIRDLVERGLDSTIKNQELAKLRRELLQAKNPDATAEELDSVSKEHEVEQVAQKILNSSYAEDFKQLASQLPEQVTQQMRSDPRMLEAFSVDVESGLAQKIMPKAQRYMDIDGLDFKEAYLKAGGELMQSEQRRSESVDRLTAVPKSTGNVETKERSIWDIPDDEFQALMATERR